MPKRTAKVKDKWREKTWLTVLAPKAFGSKPVAKIPVTDLQNAMNRRVETTLFDLLQQDPAHYNIKLFFKIDKIEDETAYTIFKGHEYSREFIKSLIRRGSSMVSFISDYKTRDGFMLRVYVSAFTQGRVNSSKKSSIRKAADAVLKEKAASLPYEQFVQEIILGKVGADVFGEAKKISALRHMDIRKTKLVSIPAERERQSEEVVPTTS